VGTLWNLTSIEPLVRAISSLAKQRPELAERLELVVAGRRTAQQESLLDAVENSTVQLTRLDYLDHDQAVALIQQANGLVLLLSDMEFAGRVVPGKLFECLATGNAIFNIAPKGEVWRLLADYPRAFSAEPKNVPAIADSLIAEVDQFVQSGRQPPADFAAGIYERRELTGKLAKLLQAVAKNG
jgi:hypothetical protein